MSAMEIELTLPAVTRRRGSLGSALWRFVRKKPLGAAGGVLIVAMVVTALFANVLQTQDPIATDAANTLAAAPRTDRIHPGVLRYLREVGVAR